MLCAMFPCTIDTVKDFSLSTHEIVCSTKLLVNRVMATKDMGFHRLWTPQMPTQALKSTSKPDTPVSPIMGNQPVSGP